MMRNYHVEETPKDKRRKKREGIIRAANASTAMGKFLIRLYNDGKTGFYDEPYEVGDGYTIWRLNNGGTIKVTEMEDAKT